MRRRQVGSRSPGTVLHADTDPQRALDGRTGRARTASMRRRQVGSRSPGTVLHADTDPQRALGGRTGRARTASMRRRQVGASGEDFVDEQLGALALLRAFLVMARDHL